MSRVGVNIALAYKCHIDDAACIVAHDKNDFIGGLSLCSDGA